MCCSFLWRYCLVLTNFSSTNLFRQQKTASPYHNQYNQKQSLGFLMAGGIWRAFKHFLTKCWYAQWDQSGDGNIILLFYTAYYYGCHAHSPSCLKAEKSQKYVIVSHLVVTRNVTKMWTSWAIITKRSDKERLKKSKGASQKRKKKNRKKGSESEKNANQ